MISGHNDAVRLRTRMYNACRADVVVDGKVESTALALVVGLLCDRTATSTTRVGGHFDLELPIGHML